MPLPVNDTANDAAIISVRDLRKTYRSGLLRRKRDALQGVDLEVPRGQVFGLLGPNGAGKTTLIKVLLGVVRHWTGEASLFGYRAGTVDARRRVGYLPENLRLASHHTATTALNYYGRLAGLDWSTIAKRSAELLELVGLADRTREPVTRYSKGMVQRLGLAQALLHDPDLLILDEPTDGLDPKGRADVRMLLRRLGDAGKTIFLNSHILQEVELVCDRVAVLAAGKVRAQGSLAEIAAQLPPSERVRIELVGATAAQLLAAIPTATADQITALQNGILRAELPAAASTQIDQYVDQLRAAGLSIANLQMQRPSLEEMFISVVGPA